MPALLSHANEYFLMLRSPRIMHLDVAVTVSLSMSLFYQLYLKCQELLWCQKTYQNIAASTDYLKVVKNRYKNYLGQRCREIVDLL